MLQALLVVALFGGGLITCITGKLAASSNREVPKIVARPIGGVLLLASVLALLPHSLFSGFGELGAQLAPYCISIGVSVMALITGMVLSEPKQGKQPGPASTDDLTPPMPQHVPPPYGRQPIDDSLAQPELPISFGQQSFVHPPVKKGLSTGAILGIIFGFGVAGILTCGGVAFVVVRLVAVDSDEVITQSTNTGVASLDVPKNWMPLTGDNANPEASLQMGNVFAETYAMVLSEPKPDVAEFAGDSLGGGMLGDDPFAEEGGEVSLEAYADLIIGNMIARNEGLTGPPKQATTVNGMPAYRFSVRGPFDGNRIVFIGLIAEGQRDFHQVLCWTLEDREVSNMPKLESVLKTFREY